MLCVCDLFISFRFLGHLYAAEALISLDRISDAITHLNPENVTDVSLGISSNEQDQGSFVRTHLIRTGHRFHSLPVVTQDVWKFKGTVGKGRRF